MSIGKRIAVLRNKMGLTQQELADRLFVTDKAVSKWERDGGEPNTQALIEMAKIFEVSVDYLLTGIENEKIVIMSMTEKIAIDDNVEDFKKVLYSELNRSDEKGTTILEYIYKYKSKKIFDYYINKQDGRQLLGGHYDKQKHIDNFIMMCFETDNMEKISDVNPKAILNLSRVYFEGQNIQPHIYQTTYTISSKFINYVMENPKVIEYILSQGDIYWSNALIKVMEPLVEKRDTRVGNVLSFIESRNEEALSFYNTKKNDYLGPSLREDGIYGREYHGNEKRVKVLTKLTRQTVINAINNDDYELAKRLNTQAGNVVTEHEFKMDQITKNDSLSKDEKAIESVVYSGIVDIDKLIALDNYKLYEKVIKLPASKVEMAINLVKDNKLKELFAMTLKEDMSHTLEALRKDRMGQLEQAVRNDHPGKNDKINAKYVKSDNNYKPALGKDTILFEDIIKHKDIKFFAHACKTDLEKIDWALEEVVKERAKEYDLILLLLDNGAKLHKRWYEDDGWGYQVGRDEIDEVGTQLLRNQIEIFMKEKK